MVTKKEVDLNNKTVKVDKKNKQIKMEKDVNKQFNKKKKFNFIEFYSNLIVDNPIKVIIIMLFIAVFSILSLGGLVTENAAVDEILPPSMPVVSAIQKLNENLGGGESTAFMVVLELDPVIGSDIIDIRDPRVLRYSQLLSKQIMQIEDVVSVSGIGTNTYGLNGDSYVNDIVTAKKIIDDNPVVFSRMVNDKYTLSIIRVGANQGFDVGDLTIQVQKIIDNTEKPEGISSIMAGEQIAKKISEDLTGPDSSKTTMISLFAIILILLLTFRSGVYGTLPLFTIIFGVIFTFGFIVVSGTKFSSISGGAISMIVGIGIDFGIQTIMRFKQELAKLAKPVLALKKTMQNVLKPMFITTLASFMGFWAMTLGDFTILQDLGKTMAFGVTFCFIAAVTVVPAILILWELHKPKMFTDGFEGIKIFNKVFFAK